MQRVLATTLVFSLLSGIAFASEDLDRALALVPDDAVGFVAWPSPKKSSSDCAALLEQIGAGGAMIAGRPIDFFKASFGVGANFDETAPVVLFGVPAVDATATPDLVFIVGTTDPAAFIQANLTPEGAPEQGRFRTADGQVISARAVGHSIVASSSHDAVRDYDMTKRASIAARVQGRLTEEEWLSLDRADFVLWANAAGMRAGTRIARESAPVDADTAVATTLANSFNAQFADGVVAIDIDPLGVWARAIGIAQEGSALASLAATQAVTPAAKCSRLPGNPFYFATSIDLVGIGGAESLLDGLALFGVDREALPAWLLTDAAAVTGVQFAAYPSKLGVAVGGVLNDSALFIASRNPEGTLARMKESFLALQGESGGVKREAHWTDAKQLKSGAVASAFELKETVLDLSKQAPGAEYMRLGKQFIVGVRGLVGLAAVTKGGVVVTFSQRPDVFGRAMAAGSAGGDIPLSQDATITSMEEWLPPKRDVEVMLGVGRLAMLASSIMQGIGSAFGDEAAAAGGMNIQKPDPSLEPVLMAFEVGGGRIDGSLVLPTGVLKYLSTLYAQQSKGSSTPSTTPSEAQERDLQTEGGESEFP